eukprot:2030123-Pleurochrysis_carterae.AAC.2
MQPSCAPCLASLSCSCVPDPYPLPLLRSAFSQTEKLNGTALFSASVLIVECLVRLRAYESSLFVGSPDGYERFDCIGAESSLHLHMEP